MARDVSYPFAVSPFVGRPGTKNTLSQLSEKLDFWSYEQHRPDYPMYVDAWMARDPKPVLSADRFRVSRREGGRRRRKDYNLVDYPSRALAPTTAGGIGNIWGYLLRPSGTKGYSGSEVYPNRAQIQTWSSFLFAKAGCSGISSARMRTSWMGSACASRRRAARLCRRRR